MKRRPPNENQAANPPEWPPFVAQAHFDHPRRALCIILGPRGLHGSFPLSVRAFPVHATVTWLVAVRRLIASILSMDFFSVLATRAKVRSHPSSVTVFEKECAEGNSKWAGQNRAGSFSECLNVRFECCCEDGTRNEAEDSYRAQK